MTGKPGIVVIGRNEGKRLERCLDSMIGGPALVVYVDSGSTDGSPDLARARGVTVVELDTKRPYTMARGRNAGFERLMELEPDVEYVQFVDGDCEVAEAWLSEAVRLLKERGDVGAVYGRRRERAREQSIYNRVTDMEWDGRAGEALFAGGDVMVRADAFRTVGGYNEEMIAGEDPEMSVRIRQADWKIVRIDTEMTLHDAAISRFGQWWRRAVRGGHAYAEGAFLHRHSDERPWARECRSSWVWGLLLPATALIGAGWAGGWTLLLLALYPIWVSRISLRRRRDFRDSWVDCLLYGVFCMLSKFPHVIGQSMFRWNQLTGRRAELIEYKLPEANGTTARPAQPGSGASEEQ